MDPVQGFQADNVEAQARDPASLLNGVKRILSIRRQYTCVSTRVSGTSRSSPARWSTGRLATSLWSGRRHISSTSPTCRYSGAAQASFIWRWPNPVATSPLPPWKPPHLTSASGCANCKGSRARASACCAPGSGPCRKRSVSKRPHCLRNARGLRRRLRVWPVWRSPRRRLAATIA